MTELRFVTRLLALLLLAVPRSAEAFPELLRYGYVNCTSCHVSPSGGGVLTPYGRQLSAEVLSTWSWESEPNFAYVVKTPEWLNLGGDARAVEIYRNTPQAVASRFLLMQADLEVAASYGKLTADARVGGYDQLQGIQSRQFYLDFKPTDEISLRAGKFQQAFGLMEPDHTTPIRRGLGWDEGTESYNLEAAWLGETFNAYVTANLGPLDSPLIPDSSKEKGVALRMGVPFVERYQVGASYFHGTSDVSTREVAGPFALLGFTQHFFLLSEIDLQAFHGSPGANPSGWVTWNKLDYEPIQGLHGYLTYELTRPDFGDSSKQSSAWGVGSQFFPRPHFEFDLQWKFQSVPGFPSNVLDYATLLLHFYP